MKIYFARHGESEANVLHVFSNSGQRHPLTEKGVRQAYSLADALKPTLFAAIYTSPVLRAVQTSQILSKELGAPVTISQALCEFDVGELEGRSDELAWQAHISLIQNWRFPANWDARHAGGESYNDMRSRFVPFIDQLIRRNARKDINILAVSHGGLYMCMLPLIFDNVGFEYALEHPLQNTSLVIGSFTASKRECLAWGDQNLEAAP